mmetsp:Transcript_31494/g.35803  ORF Transcript_31494/g.35803 Transcript_31494/m.35803 type:complete len:121 (-) Transcript_31494:194-556(-)|eukprot:CAMPEP_0115006954 /NCGR_PEP_ID=MMETSP0216-20121206/20838_1 /TAXON_ID=223996 /ORGANISM="Protocruzia adherens, Strain Boccale" /LENGTH=120 /DNA_ID=CAMNT_0002373697 /DNA_START=39 /DNA_END=401 /DNA_ORIENTATION=-
MAAIPGVRPKKVAGSPDKGSFPLDHFHECDEFAQVYRACLNKHRLMPKRCQQYQMEYLECRMNSGLMEQTPMKKLGFSEQSSWETEAREKEDMWNRIQKYKEGSVDRMTKMADMESEEGQ